jgi:hypothetical protein
MATWDSCFSSVTGAEDVATIKCLEPLFTNVVNMIVALSGVGLFLMLVIGGFNFLFSGGDQKKLEMARGTITNALMGLVLLVAAYLILKTIEIFTGVQVTKFQVFFP